MSKVDHIEEGREPVPSPPPRDGEPEGSSILRLVMVALGVVLLGITAGLSWVLVILALVVIIFLHELGHFITARAAGMKCTEFFIGFGPRIWSFHRGETEYGIKAIPAGAYVKVIGMTNLEEVDPADEGRTYRQKSYWRRMSVAVAGSAMHFLIALACLFALLAIYGVTRDDVWEVGRLAAVEDEAGSPAAAAGMEIGDEVVAVGGAPVDTFDDLRDALAPHGPGDEVRVAVERDGDVENLSVTLGDNGNGGAFLGIGPTYPSESVPVLEAIPEAMIEFRDVSWMSIGALVDFFSPSGLSEFVGLAVDTDDEEAGEPVAGEVTAAEGGENRVLSIFGVARLGSQAAENGLAPLIGLMALVNIFIGIFNLVPLLPLDGGHVAVATYERARELLSRGHARYHADVAKLLPITYAFVFVLVGVGLMALYLDITDPVNLPN